MYSELIVVVITSKEDLSETWRLLEKSQGGQLFKLIDMVLVHRDATAKVSFQARRRDSVGLLTNGSRLAGAFAEAIFDISGAEGRRQLVEAGLDPHFLKDIDQALKLDSSAYLIYVPREGLIDTHRYLEILGQLKGDLHHTIFRSQVEEALLNKNS